MEFPGEHRAVRPEHLGGTEEKQQMLHLNRRLEAYLNRVKLLEEENALLAKEIQAVRRSSQGAGTLRRSLEEELQRARLEVEAAWRDRLVTELEVGKMAEELQALDLRQQWEAQAKVTAKAKLEQSRKELEEEQRAQVWLREQAAHLEHQIRLLVQTHQDDMARLEAELTGARVTPPHTPAQRAEQTPNLLQLGQEFSRRAARAWQEAAEAHQGQLAQLEESLHQARGRLTHVGQERHESQLKLQALEKEITSAQEVRQHLENVAAQQSGVHQQEVRQLQEHLEGLEAEKEQIGQQIDRLILENRGLWQRKTSLGLEVATYRALLDGEGFRGSVRTLNQPKITSTADAVFNPRGVKMNHQILPGRHKTTPFQSAVTSVAPIYCRKPAVPVATTQETSSPKILQGGAVESLRPQEVHEKVTHAEPPSASDEQESPAGSREVEELQNKAGPPVETPVVESVVSHQVESFLSREPSFNDDYLQFTSPSLMPSHVGATDDHCGVLGKSKKVYFQAAAEEEDALRINASVDTWANKPRENERDDYSDSETEAMLQPKSESKTSSPESECVSEEIVTEFNLDEKVAGIRRKLRSSTVGRSQTDADDKLYPDGEEMDTWDSVIERKVNLRTGEAIKCDEGERQHAEPEEDISEHTKGEFRQRMDVQQEDSLASSLMVSKQVDDEQQTVLERGRPDRVSDEDEEDEDDSQNVSVSWRTELESDSYAQDNTLADTRPLIRYKSDEADANTHMDESESSEGEQDRRAKEVGMGTWTEDKAKRFGTMEDLCEEIEGEMIDEPYSLAYIQTEEMDVGHDSAASEQLRPAGDAGNAEHKEKENEEHSEVETEKLIKLINIDHDEELETDRHVEQELACLTTDSYSAHFAERQVREKMLDLMESNAQEVTKPEEAKETKTECRHSVQSDESENKGLVPSSTIINPVSENLYSTASSVVTDRTNTVAEFDVQHEDHEPVDTPETREEDNELHILVMTHADATEVQSGFTDRLLADTEEVNISEDSKCLLPIATDQKKKADAADRTEEKEAILTATKVSHEDLVKCHQEISDKLQQPQLDNVEESQESQEESAQDVEHYQEIYGNLQQAQPGNIAETSKESQVPGSQEISHKLEQPQLDDMMEASKTYPDQPVEDAADIQELSSNLQQSPPDGLLEASIDAHGEQVEAVKKISGNLQQAQLEMLTEVSKERREQLCEAAACQEAPGNNLQLSQLDEAAPKSQCEPGDDAEDCQEHSSILQKSPPFDQSQASEESQAQLVEEAAGGEKLFGFLKQSPADDFMGAASQRSKYHPGEEAPELSSSLDSQSAHLQDKSKEAQDKPLEDAADCPEEILMEAFKKSEENQTEDVADFEDFPEAPETEEWEVLENPTKDCEIQDQETSGQKCYLDARSCDESTETHQDEPLETSPGSLPGQRDIFMLKDATESKLSDFFPSGVKSDFWVTSLEGAATFQPEDNSAAKLTNQNTGFAGNVTWGSSENKNVVNGNSEAETDLPEPQAAPREEKETTAEVKQVPCRNVVEGEPVHSEESEVDGESWSS